MWKCANHTEDFRKLEYIIELVKEKLEELRIKLAKAKYKWLKGVRKMENDRRVMRTLSSVANF